MASSVFSLSGIADGVVYVCGMLTREHNVACAADMSMCFRKVASGQNEALTAGLTLERAHYATNVIYFFLALKFYKN